MAKKSDKAAGTSEGVLTSGGVPVEAKVVTGADNKLSAKEQGQIARGEIDAETRQPVADDKASGLKLKEGVNAANDARTDKEKADDIKRDERLEVLAAASQGKRKVLKTDETLYRGDLTLTGKSATTGEEVSIKYTQAEPTTEEGVYHAFCAHHPGIIRDTMKIDPENKDDPTKRTHLEKPSAGYVPEEPGQTQK